jgi:hypothetical protein
MTGSSPDRIISLDIAPLTEPSTFMHLVNRRMIEQAEYRQNPSHEQRL